MPDVRVAVTLVARWDSEFVVMRWVVDTSERLVERPLTWAAPMDCERADAVWVLPYVRLATG